MPLLGCSGVAVGEETRIKRLSSPGVDVGGQAIGWFCDGDIRTAFSNTCKEDSTVFLL